MRGLDEVMMGKTTISNTRETVNSDGAALFQNINDSLLQLSAGEGKVSEKSRRQGVEVPVGRIWKLHRRAPAGLAGDWPAKLCLGTS